MKISIFAQLAVLACAVVGLRAATSVTSNGVTWTFAKSHETGAFANGDPWIVGPATVVSIANTLNDPAFKPRPGQNGSMVNPGTGLKQGYDSTLSNYDASLNAGLPGGRAVAADNPLALPVGTTLVTTVSWLFNSPEDREPGAPKFSTPPGSLRPIIRSAALLTVLAEKPPADAFRPPYCGTDKTPSLRVSALNYEKLPRLALPAGAKAPAFATLADAFAKTWLDHVNGWLGGFTHPSMHMPNYGRDMGVLVGDATLRLFTDPAPRGQNPDKDRLVVGLVQYGIDLAGIAKNKGGWPADGGHGLGRKLPILFAGALLGDSSMLAAGDWNTRFQEDEQTFYVTQAEIDITNGPTWAPDKRASTLAYTAKDLGVADWGIRHIEKPTSDNAHWSATYREVNGAAIPAFALSARLMGLKTAWKHDAFFDYCDRYMTWRLTEAPTANRPSAFLVAMWDTYRATAP